MTQPRFSGLRHPSMFASMLFGAVVPAVLAVPLITGIVWVWRGERGVLSAVVGALVAFAIFFVGLLAIKLVVDDQPALSIAGAMVVYFGQLIAVTFVVVLLRGSGWLDGRVFAGAVVAEGLVWQVGLITGFLRGRHEVYDGPSVQMPSSRR